MSTRFARRVAENARSVMAEKAGGKVGRNSPCPCNSGRKYKHCHGKKMAPRKVPRRRPMVAGANVTGTAAEAIDTSTDVVVTAMKRAKVQPALIHAYKKTRLWITDVSRHTYSPEDVQAWDSAIAEYNAAQGD